MSSYAEKLVAPVQELNALAVKNIEDLTALQLQTIKENVTVGVETIKSAATIVDLEGLQSFLKEQAEVARKITEDIFVNVRTVAELSQGSAVEAREIAEASLKAAK